MEPTLLGREQEALLADEREALAELLGRLAAVGAGEPDLAALRASLRQLDELFLVVVVGEFNAGKSTLVNALLGQPVLAEGVTPTTTRIQLLRHAEAPAAAPSGGNPPAEVRADAELLRHLTLVDTPGTNALARDHETLTQQFVPRADLVFFVTSADRPFTESERAFLEGVRTWGKKLVVVVNKVDILRRAEERDEVLAFVRQAARDLVGVEPPVFPVAARDALEAKQAGDEARLASTGLPELERYLAETLDQTERLRLKLGNPLGVAERLATTYGEAVAERAELLAEDFTALDAIESQLGLYQEDLRREFRFRLADVDNLLHELERRGSEYFDETLRLARIPDLLNKARLRADFERKVVGDLPQEVEAKVGEIIEWLVASELRQWRGASDLLEARKAHHADRIVGRVGTFDQDRQRLLGTVGRAAHRALEEFDRQEEARRMADAVQQAVARTALVEAGAVGLGAAVTLLATTQLADLTGILAAGTLAALGLFILPARRRKAKAELEAKVLALREELMGTLTEQFDREVEGSVRRIQEAIAPYTRFVRAERERLEAAREALDAARHTLAGFRDRIAAL